MKLKIFKNKYLNVNIFSVSWSMYVLFQFDYLNLKKLFLMECMFNFKMYFYIQVVVPVEIKTGKKTSKTGGYRLNHGVTNPFYFWQHVSTCFIMKA